MITINKRSFLISALIVEILQTSLQRQAKLMTPVNQNITKYRMKIITISKKPEATNYENKSDQKAESYPITLIR